jgi:colanic acid biosynthesis glycosyl transferase WcaI
LRNVVFRPFQPEERLPEVQASGDVSLVVLSADFAESSVPSKVLAYMAAGRGIIAAVPPHSPTAVLIERAAAGVIVPPDDASALAQAIERLAANREEARRLGAAARDYAVANLSKSVGVACLESAVRRALTSQ